MILTALTMALVFQRIRASRLRWRRVVFYVGDRLTASFPIVKQSPVSLSIRHSEAGGNTRYERLRIAYGPHNLLGVAWNGLTFYIGLRDVEYVIPVRGELNLRVFDQILHVHATQDQIIVSLQITQAPSRSAHAATAVHPRLKIIPRKAA
jgi:hypothetical protein